MKKTFYILLSLTILLSFGCVSSKKKLAKGEYDEAVKKAVKKLQKNRHDREEALVLEQAYPLALQKDMERINYLNVQGRADRWIEIYDLYMKIDTRQAQVQTVTPVQVHNKTIKFQHVDYSRQIVEAKDNAALYYYSVGKELMTNDNRLDYREAYYNFKKALDYNPEVKDASKLMNDCKIAGTTYAMLIGVNETIYKLSNEFMVNIIDHPIEDYNSEWVQYYNKDVQNGNYDIKIYAVLKIADVSANEEKESKRTESKKVKDGWEYALDENGEILTDSLGNKIKVDKYKSIFCDVIQVTQFKIAHIEGFVEYENTKTKQIIRSIPVAADHRFEHIYTIANGDLDALSTETRRSLGVKPVAYPNDMDMLWAANDALKNVIGQALWDNRGFLERW